MAVITFTQALCMIVRICCFHCPEFQLKTAKKLSANEIEIKMKNGSVYLGTIEEVQGRIKNILQLEIFLNYQITRDEETITEEPKCYGNMFSRYLSLLTNFDTYLDNMYTSWRKTWERTSVRPRKINYLRYSLRSNNIKKRLRRK